MRHTAINGRFLPKTRSLPKPAKLGEAVNIADLEQLLLF